ncbi:hypothetical protein P3T37_005782 [Kitasatospora sp. MAA4]|uniref:type VII secretion target n=1 Tax=Kitasatospora sp. MAA4 TaxID=3035093 RepID=UPI00247415CB|nr:type VII secretion target [Kitasatospora sp. MAA4]MDH6136357.1 hypothetical protein [Kitasatospora sp. MAA4]
MPIPDAGGGFQVNPDELEGAGQSAQGLAEQIPGETKNVLAPSDQASSGLAGWTTGAALHDCTYDWQKLLDGLAGDMDGYGAKLIQMAQGYQQSDQGAAADLRSVQTSSRSAAYQSPAGSAGSADPFGTMLAGEPRGPVV